MLIVPLLPHNRRPDDVFADRPDEHPVHQAEHEWNGVAQIALFMFGLINAGVILKHIDTGTWAVLVAALATAYRDSRRGGRGGVCRAAPAETDGLGGCHRRGARDYQRVYVRTVPRDTALPIGAVADQGDDWGAPDGGRGARDDLRGLDALRRSPKPRVAAGGESSGLAGNYRGGTPTATETAGNAPIALAWPCPPLMRIVSAKDPDMTLEFKRILVPLDFSTGSTRALDYAYALAMKFDASLHLVHVCEVPSMMTASMDALIAYTDWSQRLGEEAGARAREAAAAPRPVKFSSEVLFGNPARAIVTAAATSHADLIVMGTHGHGPVMHVVMGNVAERVVRMAMCPRAHRPRAAREGREENRPPRYRRQSPGSLAALLMSPLGASVANAQENPPAQPMKQTVSGGELFRTYCASCHGTTARGDGRWRRPWLAGRRISPRSPSGTAASFRRRWSSA